MYIVELNRSLPTSSAIEEMLFSFINNIKTKKVGLKLRDLFVSIINTYLHVVVTMTGKGKNHRGVVRVSLAFRRL